MIKLCEMDEDPLTRRLVNIWVDSGFMVNARLVVEKAYVVCTGPWVLAVTTRKTPWETDQPCTYVQLYMQSQAGQDYTGRAYFKNIKEEDGKKKI